MFVLNGARNMIVNMAQVERVTLVEKNDAVVMMAGFGDGNACSIGRFNDRPEAMAALMELYTSLYDGSLYFEIPQRKTIADDIVKDHRVKRKGGS